MRVNLSRTGGASKPREAILALAGEGARRREVMKG
jgi:hypothetical protein